MAHACYLYSEEAEAGRLLAVDNSGLLHKPNKTYTLPLSHNVGSYNPVLGLFSFARNLLLHPPVALPRSYSFTHLSLQ